MNRFPVILGVAEFQSTAYRDPRALPALANRIQALRSLPHTHEVSRRVDGALEYIVTTSSGEERRATPTEFAVYVAESLVMLRREWPEIISGYVWPKVSAELDQGALNCGYLIPEAVKAEICAALVAFVDEFDFDSSKTLYSWAVERAHAAIKHRQQSERDAQKPAYQADGSGNDAARITREHYGSIDPLEELFRHEVSEAGNALAVRIRKQIDALRPQRLREIAKLRLLNAQTFQQISDRLRIPLKTAQGRFETAKRRLEAMLSPADRNQWLEISTASQEVAANQTDSDWPMGCQVTNLRKAKLSNAAIDQGTLALTHRSNPSPQRNGTNHD